MNIKNFSYILYCSILTFSLQAYADPVTISNISYNGDTFPAVPISNLYDGNTATIARFQGTGGTVSPNGRTFTITLDDAYNLYAVNYWGDDNISSPQGIENFTLEFLLNNNSQGTFSDNFANVDSSVEQIRSFSTIRADELLLTVDSSYSGAAAFGGISSEIAFAAVPLPSSLLFMLIGGGSLLGFFGRLNYKKLT